MPSVIKNIKRVFSHGSPVITSQSLLGYKVYSALLTQSGTNAPVATVLTNTLGFTPVWSRQNAGQYYLTYTGGFPSTKTFILGEKRTVVEERSSDDAVVVNSFDSDLTTLTDDILTNTSIEIRVYN